MWTEVPIQRLPCLSGRRMSPRLGVPAYQPRLSRQSHATPQRQGRHRRSPHLACWIIWLHGEVGSIPVLLPARGGPLDGVPHLGRCTVVGTEGMNGAFIERALRSGGRQYRLCDPARRRPRRVLPLVRNCRCHAPRQANPRSQGEGRSVLAASVPQSPNQRYQCQTDVCSSMQVAHTAASIFGTAASLPDPLVPASKAAFSHFESGSAFSHT